MNGFYIDLALSGLTYVMLAYLSFRLMRSKRKGGRNNNGGGGHFSNVPVIDLPPGVVWPGSPEITKKEKEEVLF